jgi:actin-related protein
MRAFINTLDRMYFIINKVRGILVNFDFQMNLWTRVFNDQLSEKNAKGYSLTISNPLASPQRSKEKLLEILYEYYGFSALCIKRHIFDFT